MQGIFRKENTDKALKYGIYRHLPTYEKIIRNLVSFYSQKTYKYLLYDIKYIIKNNSYFITYHIFYNFKKNNSTLINL